MASKEIISFLFLVVLVFQPIVGHAFETDQYNLPPAPLADIGEEVSEHAAERLLLAVARLNAEITIHQACLEGRAGRKGGCGSKGEEIRKLEFLRSEEAIAAEVFKTLGAGGVFETTFGRWIRSHKFSHVPSQYKSDYMHSIYTLLPTNYITISPTVRLFGAEFGTDKIDHFFQQGHTYYSVRRKYLKRGLDKRQAEERAVRWGRRTEKTYFGSWVSGVYSNADLFANFAGMRFYQRLTEPIQIGDIVYAPFFKLRDGFWNISADGDDWQRNLLRPFVTDHMNEALNPSGYSFILIAAVRKKVVKFGCPEWRKAYPGLLKTDFEKRTKSLEKWNGEDYGFALKKRIVSIAEVCFSS